MPVTQQLVSGLKAIVSSSLAPNTWKLYNRAWTVLQDFGRTVHISVFPLESYNLGLFISYLFQKGYSTATIRTFVSAIGFYHKVNGLHDPSSSYMVEKAIQGLKKLRPTIDKRRAITIDMLANMVCSLFNLPLTMYERYLFKSMFLIAFFGLFRVGEITDSPHNVKVSNVSFTVNPEKVVFQCESFKHSVGPRSIHINRHAPTWLCPVQALKAFNRIRQNVQGPLFVDDQNRPIQRSHFVKILRSSLSICGYDTKVYQTHSFRIGGATLAASKGMSILNIQNLGRWKSNAFIKYIRY